MNTKRAEGPDEPMLGPCCACEATGPLVRNIFMITRRGIVAGHGWGCFVCGLPSDGATYVLCDDCFDLGRKPVHACRGYPAEDGRVAIEVLTTPFDHDMTKHAADREDQE